MKAVIVMAEGLVEVDADNLLAAAEIRGFVWSGKVHTNPKTRAEMQGQPIFKNLCGPMYGGPGVVRYETPAINDMLSR